MNKIEPGDFKQAMFNLLDETFENVSGYFLDGGTSIFETLATITAEEASIPIGSRCATLAAQVRHVAFYLNFVVESVQNPDLPPVDWGEIWRLTSGVDDNQWSAIQSDLRESYLRIKNHVNATPGWGEPEISGAIAVIAHSAYHLGEIRQALCTIQNSEIGM